MLAVKAFLPNRFFAQILFATSLAAIAALYFLSASQQPQLIELQNASNFVGKTVLVQGRLVQANYSKSLSGLICASGCLKIIFSKTIDKTLLPKKTSWLKARGKVIQSTSLPALMIESVNDFEAS